MQKIKGTLFNFRLYSLIERKQAMYLPEKIEYEFCESGIDHLKMIINTGKFRNLLNPMSPISRYDLLIVSRTSR
jgi:hypothetical protein